MSNKLTIKDYEEVFEDHQRLVREIDVMMNGKNAAPQASLCDLVTQIEDLVVMAMGAELAREKLRQANRLLGENCLRNF